MTPATSALPLAIMIVTGLGALVVALLVAAVAQHPAFWRGLA